MGILAGRMHSPRATIPGSSEAEKKTAPLGGPSFFDVVEVGGIEPYRLFIYRYTRAGALQTSLPVLLPVAL